MNSSLSVARWKDIREFIIVTLELPTAIIQIGQNFTVIKKENAGEEPVESFVESWSQYLQFPMFLGRMVIKL